MAIENTQDTKPIWYRWFEMLPTDACVAAAVAVEILVGSLVAVFDTAPIGRVFGLVLVVLGSVYAGAYFGRLRQVIDIETRVLTELGIDPTTQVLLRLLDRSQTDERRRQIMIVVLMASFPLWLLGWLAYSQPFGMWM